MTTTSAKERTSVWAVASLIFGLLGFIPFVPSFIAIVLGHVARGSIKNSAKRDDKIKIGGRTPAMVGLFLGYFGLLAWLLGSILFAGTCAFVADRAIRTAGEYAEEQREAIEREEAAKEQAAEEKRQRLQEAAGDFQPIMGAAEIEFGQVMQLSEGMRTNAAGLPVYPFTPTKPIRRFTEYYVTLTPKTKQVAAIELRAPFPTKAEVESEREFTWSVLEEKYGPRQREMGKTFIKQGDRRITVRVDMEGEQIYMLVLHYSDQELLQLAEAERIAIEKEKADTSGL